MPVAAWDVGWRRRTAIANALLISMCVLPHPTDTSAKAVENIVTKQTQTLDALFS